MSIQSYYESDYVRWLDLTAEQLRQQRIENLDWQHLIKEIEALGNEQRRKVESYLKQLLIHLLLYKYWEQERDYCAQGWENEIDNFRDELEFLLRSKTLYNYCCQNINRVYPKARRRVIKKTNLVGVSANLFRADDRPVISPAAIFPQQCPFTLEEILNPDYLPK